MTVVETWTRLLRRPDELSHVAMLLGMQLYKPNPVKAAWYASQRNGG